MDRDSGIKRRREMRIQELLTQEIHPQDGHPQSMHPQEEDSHLRPIDPYIRGRQSQNRHSLNPKSSVPLMKDSTMRVGQAQEMEPDPEYEWKKNRHRWDDTFTAPRKPSFMASFIRRLWVSAALFGLLWGVFHWEVPYSSEIRLFVADTMHRDMDVQSVAGWYEEHFGGSPAFLPIFKGLEQKVQQVHGQHHLAPPVRGSIVQPFAVSLKGIEIVPESFSTDPVLVKSMDAGRVMDVVPGTEGDTTVVIRHTDGLTAVYGRLSSTSLRANDWVQEGDVVGQFTVMHEGQETNTLYLAVKQGEQYVDPAEVVAFD